MDSMAHMADMDAADAFDIRSTNRITLVQAEYTSRKTCNINRAGMFCSAIAD
jgi:hypothetical protein